MDFSIIIVSYNVSVLLAQAIRAVQRASDDLNVEIWVVDNASKDDSVERVRREFPEVKLIANADNPGFGKANNQAMRQAKGEYFLILNPDTIIQEDFLQVMKRFMDEQPECGAVGSKILDPNGAFSPTCRRAFPRPSVALWRILGFSKWFPKSRTFGQYNLTFLDENQVAEVDALSGSCMTVRRNAIFNGQFFHIDNSPSKNQTKGINTDTPDSRLQTHDSILFDEDFFMYGEDLDWCYRIQKAGWKIMYTPETHVLHYKGESTDKQDIRYVKLFYGAMVVFMEKHFAGQYATILVQFLKIGVHIRAGLAALKQKLKRLTPVKAQKNTPDFQNALWIGSEKAFLKLQKAALFSEIQTISAQTKSNEISNISMFSHFVFDEESVLPSKIFSIMQDFKHLSVEFCILTASQKELIGENFTQRIVNTE